MSLSVDSECIGPGCVTTTSCVPRHRLESWTTLGLCRTTWGSWWRILSTVTSRWSWREHDSHHIRLYWLQGHNTSGKYDCYHGNNMPHSLHVVRKQLTWRKWQKVPQDHTRTGETPNNFLINAMHWYCWVSPSPFQHRLWKGPVGKRQPLLAIVWPTYSFWRKVLWSWVYHVKRPLILTWKALNLTEISINLVIRPRNANLGSWLHLGKVHGVLHTKRMSLKYSLTFDLYQRKIMSALYLLYYNT